MWQQVELALSQSAHRALVTLANFLPGVVALLLAILLLTAIGAGIAALLRRLLISARFDERLARNPAIPLSEWTSSHSPTSLVARAAFWACVVLGFLIGITAFDAAYAGNSQMATLLFPYLTHSVGAILLLIVGNIVARFLARSVLIGSVNMNLQYARLLSQGVKWLVLVLTAAMILDHLGIGGTIVELAFGILFGGIVLALALAIGLGSKEMVSRSLEGEREPLKRPEEAPASKLRHF